MRPGSALPSIPSRTSRSAADRLRAVLPGWQTERRARHRPRSTTRAGGTSGAFRSQHAGMTDTETPAYSGTGWKILTSRNIYSLNPDPYLIVFADTAARDKLTPYLTGPAAQATSV